MFERKRQGAVDVVHCKSPLNRDSIDSCRAAVEQCLTGGQPLLVFDFQEMKLIDSAGLEALLEWQDRVERLGGMIKLAALNPLLRDVLRITRVDRRFETFETSKAAVGSFAR